MEDLKIQIQSILDENLPIQVVKRVFIRKAVFGGEYLAIHLYMGEGQTIHNVYGQYANHVSLSLDSDLNLEFQVYGGCGGQYLYRKIDPKNQKEQYYALGSEKINFRKPKPNKEAIFKNLKIICQRYLTMLQDFKNRGLLRFTDNSYDFKKLDYSFLE